MIKKETNLFKNVALKNEDTLSNVEILHSSSAKLLLSVSNSDQPEETNIFEIEPFLSSDKDDSINEQVIHSSEISSAIENKVSKSNSVISEDVLLFNEDLDSLSAGSEEFEVHKINDDPVLCRARASLPGKYLSIRTLQVLDEYNEYAVFARRDLSKRTVFGPMEGVLCEGLTSIADGEDGELRLLVECDDGFKKLDVSNYNLSNWMRFVRPARNVEEQNLVLFQKGNHLYFSSIKKLKAKEELKVWYSNSYAASRSLQVHSRNKAGTSSTAWSCSHCRQSFDSAVILNLHVLTHAADNIETNLNKISIGETKFVCNYCSKAFSTFRTLQGHQRFHQKVKVYECPICKSKFSKLRNLRNHIPNHLVEGCFSCPDCEKKFMTYKMIRKHIRNYHGSKNFPCQECPKAFYTSDKLKIHMLSHSEIKEFLCANCGRQYKRKDKLSDHIKKVHLPGNENVISKRNKVNRKVIPQKEASNSDFELYVYKCHICMIGFKRRGMLVNHLANRHPHITPESVPELNLPILKANKDYFCQYCDKIYKSSSKRKAHILKYHPGEKLPASGRKVSKTLDGEENGTYSQTVGSFTANPHGCEWCHKQYASKAKLLQHQRKKHNDKLPKSLQVPRNRTTIVSYEDDIDTVNVGKITDSDILLFQEPLDSHISDGEFIIDANTLRRALKGEVFIDGSPETLAELGQIIENRPDQYFRVYHTSTGITFARPVEVWDPISTCQTLNPSDSSPPLSELKLN